MMQQSIEINNRIQEIDSQIAALLQEEKFIQDSISFIEGHFKEQGTTAASDISTEHLDVLQNIILEMEFREKIGAIGITPIVTGIKSARFFLLFNVP